MTVYDLRRVIQDNTKILSSHQRLVFNGVELGEETSSNGSHMATNPTLLSYGIKPGACIQLIQLLYSIDKGSDIKELIFDLNWYFPSHGNDYLDGTCFVYNKDTYLGLLDYIHRTSDLSPDLSHSGDVMGFNTGHHKIKLNLYTIPAKATHLLFTLSAYSCEDIKLFPNPTVKLYDSRKPTEELCKYSIQSASGSRAVIMCVASRSQHSGWRVEVAGTKCYGSARNYTPIKEAIQQLLKKMGVF